MRSTLMLILGVVLVVPGLFLLGLYISGVIDIIVTQPADRSWLFWGLAVAFVGVAFLGGGVAMLIIWWNTHRRAD